MTAAFPLISTLLGVSGLLALLGWVGWRFFVTPASSEPVAGDGRKQSGVPGGKSSCPFPRVENAGGDRAGSCLTRKVGTAIALVLAVGALVTGGVLLVADRITPEPLAALTFDRQTHIRGMFNPERLVPPPALPPAMFIGSGRPEMETADRDWSRLDPEFTQSVLLVMSRLEARGYPFALLEGYRSPERQEKLAALGNHVTSARAFQSKHQYGLAADIAPIKDGRLIISERDPWAMAAYMALGEEAARIGLTWGGEWWFKDFGHVEISGAVGKMRNGRSNISLTNAVENVQMAKSGILESGK